MAFKSFRALGLPLEELSICTIRSALIECAALAVIDNVM